MRFFLALDENELPDSFDSQEQMEDNTEHQIELDDTDIEVASTRLLARAFTEGYSSEALHWRVYLMLDNGTLVAV